MELNGTGDAAPDPKGIQSGKSPNQINEGVVAAAALSFLSFRGAGCTAAPDLIGKIPYNGAALS